MRHKLKIGLLLDDVDVAAWFHRMISDLEASTFAEITLVVINDNDVETQQNTTLLSKIANNRGRIGYLAIRKLLEELYARLIERSTHLPDAEAAVSSKKLLADVPTIKVKTRRGKWSCLLYTSPSPRDRG